MVRKGRVHLDSVFPSGTGYLGLASSGGCHCSPRAVKWAGGDGSQKLGSGPSFEFSSCMILDRQFNLSGPYLLPL